MAFAATTNKPMRNLNKVSGGALEEWQKNSKGRWVGQQQQQHDHWSWVISLRRERGE